MIDPKNYDEVLVPGAVVALTRTILGVTHTIKGRVEEHHPGTMTPYLRFADGTCAYLVPSNTAAHVDTYYTVESALPPAPSEPQGDGAVVEIGGPVPIRYVRVAHDWRRADGSRSTAVQWAILLAFAPVTVLSEGVAQ